MKTRIESEDFISRSFLDDRKDTSIRDKPVRRLLALLKERGIEMKPEDCLQRVEYTALRRSEKSRVPLTWRVDGYVTGYTLRTEELTIDLENHQAYSRGMPGMIGGSHPIGPPGIKVKLVYEGQGNGQEIVTTAQAALRDFYGPKLDKGLLAKVRAAVSKGGITGRPLKTKE